MYILLGFYIKIRMQYLIHLSLNGDWWLVYGIDFVSRMLIKISWNYTLALEHNKKQRLWLVIIIFLILIKRIRFNLNLVFAWRKIVIRKSSNTSSIRITNLKCLQYRGLQTNKKHYIQIRDTNKHYK